MVLENEGQSWRVLENKICFEKLLSIGLEKYLNFTFSSIQISWIIKSKVFRRKLASFEQKCQSTIIQMLECAWHENEVQTPTSATVFYFHIVSLADWYHEILKILLVKKKKMISITCLSNRKMASQVI